MLLVNHVTVTFVPGVQTSPATGEVMVGLNTMLETGAMGAADTEETAAAKRARTAVNLKEDIIMVVCEGGMGNNKEGLWGMRT